MADDPTPHLIAGRFAVESTKALADAGGGLPAYAAHDRQAVNANRVALMVSRNASPRLGALAALLDPIDNLMAPLGHGVASGPGGQGEAYYIICTAPPGPPLSASLRPWSEKALLDNVLRPMARVLDTLNSLKLTHRSIRVNNVFQAAAGQSVTLGAAWSAPPAMHQPALFESPYQAMCHPAGRGRGTIADDVYALGVLLLVLSDGRLPFARQDDQAIIRAKLEFGSFAALSRDVPLSGFLADLLRGMLADDPEHRPLPTLLMDPTAARARRVAARPARRSQRPLILNDIPVFDSQTLGYALLADEKKSVLALRSDIVTTWLRRGLGDAAMASTIEELVRDRMAETRPGPRSDALLLMRSINALNSRMPFCWRGVALWPDGLDGIFTEGIATGLDLGAITTEIMVNSIVETWVFEKTGGAGEPPPPVSREVALQRRYLQNGGTGAPLRLYYTLNPLLPCRLDTMRTAWIINIPDLMRFLERSAGIVTGNMIDPHLAAFIAARSDNQSEVQVNALLSRNDADAYRLSEIKLLRDLQTRYYAQPMPGLGKWVAARLRPELEQWRNRPKREAITAKVETLAQAGFLRQIVDLALDPEGRKNDEAYAQNALANLAIIDRQILSIDSNDKIRFANAEQFGLAITGAIGLTALILVVMSLVAQ